MGIIEPNPQPSRTEAASVPGSSASCVTMNSQGTPVLEAQAHARFPRDFNASLERPRSVRMATLKKGTGQPLKMYWMPSMAVAVWPGAPVHMMRQASVNCRLLRSTWSFIEFAECGLRSAEKQ